MKTAFEKALADKLYNHTSAVDAGMFDAIIKKRKRKKALVWWYSGAAVLMIGLTIGIGYFLSNQNDITTDNQVSEIEIPVKDNVENAGAELNEPTIQNSLNKTQALNNQTNDTRTSGNSPAKPSQAGSSVVNNSAQPEVNETTQTEQTPEEKEALKELFNKIVNTTDKENENPGKLFVRDREIASDKIIEPQWDNENAIPEKSNAELDGENKTKNEILVQKDSSKSTTDPDMDNPPLPLPKWSVELSAGPGFAGRILTGNSPEIAERNSSEQSKNGYIIGSKVSYHWSSKWALGAGVYFTSRNENFNFTKTETSTITKDTTVMETIIHPVFGTMTREKDSTMTATHSTNQAFQAVNQYKRVFIPLEVERSFAISEKWSMMAKVGGLVGIYQQSSGLSLNQDNEVVTMSELPFRKAGFQSVTAGLGTAYNVKRNVSVFFYPQAIMSLNSSMESSYALKQREYGIYSTFGLRIRFK